MHTETTWALGNYAHASEMDVLTAHLQSSKPRSAHGCGDGLDSGEQRVKQQSETASSSLDLALLVQHEPRESHRVHVHDFLGQRWSFLRHNLQLDLFPAVR